jgi:hypothetical protein
MLPSITRLSQPTNLKSCPKRSDDCLGFDRWCRAICLVKAWLQLTNDPLSRFRIRLLVGKVALRLAYKALGAGNREQGIGNRDGILIVGLKPTLNKYVFQGAKHDEKPRPYPNPRF